MEVESKLVPILREGVEVVKMIFFKELQGYLAARFPDKEKGYLNRLAGAVINELFGTPNQDEAFVAFVRQEQEVIEETFMAEVKETVPNDENEVEIIKNYLEKN